jgi:AcrR family transcriptional regulator
MPRPRGTRRIQQAAETRRTILASAQRLFSLHGYSATTISAIAIDAGVAIQTIYDSIGPKRAILLALLDQMDEEAGVGEIWREIRQLSGPVDQINAAVRLTRQFPEKYHDLIGALISAAPIEPDAAEALQEGYRRHRAGTGRFAHYLATQQVLCPDLNADHAGDVFGLLTSVQTFRQLTIDYGWSFDQCQEWITETLVRFLLPDSKQDAMNDSG